MERCRNCNKEFPITFTAEYCDGDAYIQCDVCVEIMRKREEELERRRKEDQERLERDRMEERRKWLEHQKSLSNQKQEIILVRCTKCQSPLGLMLVPESQAEQKYTCIGCMVSLSC